MKKRHLILGAVVLVFSAFLSYIFFSEGKELEIDPQIKVSIKFEEYLINGNRGKDLITLVENEYYALKLEVKPTVFLSADNTIKYERVASAMTLLKSNGYKNVSLSSQQ